MFISFEILNHIVIREFSAMASGYIGKQKWQVLESDILIFYAVCIQYPSHAINAAMICS